MSQTKSALIIANYRYEHPDLRQLAAPAQDAESLARALADRGLGGFEVSTLINEPSYKLNLEIENFCENRKRDDLLLLYFSGHGIKDADGQLYFATADTQLVQHNVRRATAVSAQFVNEVMSHSRSRQQILLLDCCYSGAFKQGMLAKGDKRVGAGEQLQGQGRIVLTASDALQYSFEGDHVQGEGVRSVFTRTLVQGLEPGEADLDRDGLFSLDEVYDYVYSRVSDEQPDQKPTKMGFTEGRIFIGSNPRPLAGRLPQDILDTLEHPLVWVRVGAVQQLETLLESSSKGLVLAAQAKLSFLAANDDSQQVRAAAAKCLASRVIVPPSPEEAGPVAELKIEVEVQAPERERPTREKPTKTRRGKAQTDWQSRSVEGNKRRAEKAEVQRKGRAKPALPAAPEVVQATRVTSPGNERESLSLRGHSDAIWSVAWSLDGARLATASDDGTVKVWNAETGQELLTLRGHGGCVRRVDWTIDLDDTPPENWLAAASTDGWFKIWDADIGEDEMDDVVGGEGWLMAWRPRLHGEPKPKSDASWLNRLRKSTPSEERMELTSLAHNVSAGEAWDDSPLGGVAVRKVRTGETLPILHHREVVRSIAWSPDGMRMARGTINGTVRVWMVEKGKELLSMAAHAGPVTSLTWSPDGYRMASASEDGKVNVYGTRVGELLLSVTPPSHPSKLWGVAWSPRANSLATGSDDQTARVWNVETGGELLTLRGHSGAVRSLAWSPDGKRLTTGSDDKTAKVWDVSH